jgi:fibrillarin-like pre-rRNA processing protein
VSLEWRTVGDDGDRVPTTPGDPIGDEPIVDGRRVWEPRESKLAAVLAKGGDVPLDDRRVLYLGAAAGTTASYVADVARAVYCVEFARGPARRLVEVARGRPRMFPVVADARRPERYVPLVETVDVLYQDVATRGQADVALDNLAFLEEGGTLCCVVKARSEDVAAEPGEIYDAVADELRGTVDVHAVLDLEPWYSDHAAVIATK